MKTAQAIANEWSPGVAQILEVGVDGFRGLLSMREPVWMRFVASDGMGWEHVSVSLPNRCPTWEEMNFAKGIFWGDEDTVVQYHPPRSQYVSCHPYCLHLWRPIGYEFPRPPFVLVGPVEPIADGILST